MNNSIEMQVGNSLHDLKKISGCSFFWKASLFFEFGVQVAHSCFHDEEALLMSNIEAIGWEDVRMFAVELDFEFVDHEL